MLLDTCALLWLVGDPTRFSARALAMLESTETKEYVSAISKFKIVAQATAHFLATTAASTLAPWQISAYASGRCASYSIRIART